MNWINQPKMYDRHIKATAKVGDVNKPEFFSRAFHDEVWMENNLFKKRNNQIFAMQPFTKVSITNDDGIIFLLF